ncbi:Sphingosine-1-phosphate phosphatase 2 [Aix galericulata]|nr:Sphingosine-1-phosphate phosphatase 2 [Aix galericulata]
MWTASHNCGISSKHLNLYTHPDQGSFRSSPPIPAETIGLDKMANTVYRKKRQKWSYDMERKEKDGVSISYCNQYLRAQLRNSSYCDCSSCKHGRVGVSPLRHLWQHIHRTRRAPRSQAEQERAPAELPEPCLAAAACLQEMELEQASLSCWTASVSPRFPYISGVPTAQSKSIFYWPSQKLVIQKRNFPRGEKHGPVTAALAEVKSEHSRARGARAQPGRAQAPLARLPRPLRSPVRGQAAAAASLLPAAAKQPSIFQLGATASRRRSGLREPGGYESVLRAAPLPRAVPSDAAPAALAAAASGRYLSQQMSQVTTTEKRARMLATDRQMGPTGDGEAEAAGSAPYWLTKMRPVKSSTTMARKETTTHTQPALSAARLQLWQLSQPPTPPEERGPARLGAAGGGAGVGAGAAAGSRARCGRRGGSGGRRSWGSGSRARSCGGQAAASLVLTGRPWTRCSGSAVRWRHSGQAREPPAPPPAPAPARPAGPCSAAAGGCWAARRCSWLRHSWQKVCRHSSSLGARRSRSK